MPIDPRISLGVQPLQIADPLAQYGQVQNILASQSQQQAAELQLQQSQRQIQQDEDYVTKMAEAIGKNGGPTDMMQAARVMSGNRNPQVSATGIQMLQSLQRLDAAKKAGANTFNNLAITSTTGTRETFTVFGANQTVSGTLTLGAGNTAIRRIRINSDVIGTPRTLTVATVAALADVDFRDITAAGVSAPWSGTRLGDCLGNTSITFVAGANKYWNLAAGGNWSDTAWATTSGGAVNVNNFPLAQDTAIIENTGLTAGNTITVQNNWQLGTVDASTRSTAATLVFASSIYKNLTLSTSITVSGTGAFAIAGRNTQTITSAGRTITNALSITSAGIVSCADALTVSNTLTFASGTLKLKNGVTSTITTFSTSGTTQKTLESTLAGSQATLSQASGTVDASYLTIKDINATGGATWNSLWSNNNVDAGNNAGWVFGNPPVILATEYTYTLRSFTQPRRF